MLRPLLLAAALAGQACAQAPRDASSACLPEIGPEEARAVGLKIWRNEMGGKTDYLTFWNKNEPFPSLGIGHFIWYPAGRQGPFTESFPGLLDALEASGERLPAWLQGRPACPWPDRESFYRDFDGERLKGLRELLARTVDVQARYAARRLEQALPKVLESAAPESRAALSARFCRIASVPNGVYALVDYVNFKGEGVNPKERYPKGPDGESAPGAQGWGLLQALELMKDAPAGQPSVEAFAKAADEALTRRVENADPRKDGSGVSQQDRERGFLPGWRKRLATYAER